MSKKLVVHLAETPLAGAPIRIVDALNRHSEFDARLINFNPNCYGARTFPEDLVWSDETQKALAMDLIIKADIFHIYHPIQVGTDQNVFGINFLEKNPTAKFLYQFESNKTHFDPQKIKYIDSMPHYKSVIIHYPERDFIGYTNLPNIIDTDAENLQPMETKNKIPVVFYSPSSAYGVADKRWNSKGKPEVLETLRKLQQQIDFKIHLVENVPYEECMRLKQQSDIIIDDITTGSFHLTALEGLSMGKPTFSFLDARSVAVATKLTGSRDLPFVNVRLKQLEKPLIDLVKDESLRKSIGAYSRFWAKKYYNEAKNIKHYEKLYWDILNENESSLRPSEEEYAKAKQYLYTNVNDHIWYDYFASEIRKKRPKRIAEFFKGIFQPDNK